MKIKNRASQPSRRTSLLVLETDKESNLTDAQLILLCDNLEGIKYNGTPYGYDLTGESLGDANHFGGAVSPKKDQRTPGCEIEVTVYTD